LTVRPGLARASIAMDKDHGGAVTRRGAWLSLGDKAQSAVFLFGKAVIVAKPGSALESCSRDPPRLS
jgi:hypothetical protein